MRMFQFRNRLLWVYIGALAIMATSYVQYAIPPQALTSHYFVLGLLEILVFLLGLWAVVHDRLIDSQINRILLRIILAVILGLVGSYVFIDIARVIDSRFSLLTQFNPHKFINVLNIIVMLLVAPAEEMLFRGYFFRHWHRSKGFWRAGLYSSLLFASVHVFHDLSVINQHGGHGFSTLFLLLMYQFIVGIFLCVCYVMSHSLPYCMIVHGLLDCSFIGLYFQQPLMIAVYLVLFLLLAVFAYWGTRFIELKGV